MAETVDDFIKHFGGGGTVDDEEAAKYHDRFVSTRPEDSQFDNRAYQQGAAEYLGKLPSDQFHDAARNAIAQAPPQQRQDLLGTLLNALGGSGGGLGAIASTLHSRVCSFLPLGGRERITTHYAVRDRAPRLGAYDPSGRRGGPTRPGIRGRSAPR